MITRHALLGWGFAALALFNGTACSKKSSPKDVAPFLPNANATPGVISQVNRDGVQGYWVTACAQPPSGLFSLGYARRQMFFDGDKLNVTVGKYDKADCSDGSLQSLLDVDTDYALGNEAKPAGGSELNLTINSVNIFAVSDDGAAFMNAGQGTCGIKDWAAGVGQSVKDVAGCDYMYTAGLVPFHVLAKDGEKLYVGAYYENDTIGQAADKRPSKLAVDEPMTKVAASIFFSE